VISGINHLLSIAQDLGLNPSANETGQWSDSYVHGFIEAMPDEIRFAGANDPSLDFYSFAGDPHNRSDEGFIDRSAKIAIAFATGA
jgi:hypothetical protein